MTDPRMTPTNDAPVTVERINAIRERLEDIRDERHFPAHMLSAHDEMLSMLDDLDAIVTPAVEGMTLAEALKLAFQEADPDARHKFDWADFGSIKPTDMGQAVIDHLSPSLAALGSAPAKQEHDRYANDEAAKALYDSWSNLPGWVPWVDRGNSTMQDKARREVAR